MSRTVQYSLRGAVFEWDAAKAASNLLKHGVSFESACEVFFDPFMRIVKKIEMDEIRHAAIGYTQSEQLIFVIHIIRHEEITRIISARRATAAECRLHKQR